MAVSSHMTIRKREVDAIFERAKLASSPGLLIGGRGGRGKAYAHAPLLFRFSITYGYHLVYLPLFWRSTYLDMAGLGQFAFRVRFLGSSRDVATSINEGL